jgi:hypothetical protein
MSLSYLVSSSWPRVFSTTGNHSTRSSPLLAAWYYVVNMGMNRHRIGISLLGAFFVFGTSMSGLSALTLFFPGTAIDQIWRINPDGHAQLLAAGPPAAAGMALLSVIMLTTAWGLFSRRRWAWWTAVAVLTVNAISDMTAAIVSHNPQTLIGVPIAALVVWWMSRPNVRALFQSRPST